MLNKSKNFILEYKKFINRGNVLDLAVGVIIGSAFTAIVNALSNNILKPIINWIISLIVGGNGAISAYSVLKPTYTEAGEIDLAASIYIDWGAFISAILNFFIVAIVLFLILRVVNKVREGAQFYNSSKGKTIRKYIKSGLSKKAAIEKYNEEAKIEEEKLKASEEEKKLEEEKKAAREEKVKDDIAKQTELLEKLCVLLSK